MERQVFIVDDQEEDTRLDLYLSNQLDQLSRSFIQKLIEQEKIKINGKQEKLKKYKVKENDVVEIEIPLPERLDIKPENIPIHIIYEDEDVVIVDKPQGMVVHPAPGNYSGTLVNALLYHCKTLSSINGVIRPGIVHRIDKDTSGLLMVAKNDKAHRSLAEQLKEHSIHRVYAALVHGNIREEKGTIDAPIGRHPVDRLKMTVTDKNSKNAVTHFEVQQRFGNYTLIEAKLETGRTHQIRVHMAYIQHPLVGDPVYGLKKEKYHLQGQALHAKELGFLHPSTSKYMEFKSPLPDYFQKLLQIIENSSRQN
ncbi:23S rRNA pseudouridine1911/1915/1917 synthase [Geosporobacter subterraneus DSM 17957]|uniref:Pseudouridine synthase n=1 Tax=Geosporobacter subterraneus DSM 17957 TaxID=1121919 RepID=A0A1M6GSS0_9FIRM|nr:RluA family pseudouridine synthase [Geosporobacter subterraneus]SHJ13008.1 23S rRNA pseudouridine1911/1915/1917 synthase [Geosporobacter subterraneus DSM 17957]